MKKQNILNLVKFYAEKMILLLETKLRKSLEISRTMVIEISAII